MNESKRHPVIHIEYPDWVDSVIDWDRTYHGDEERMRLAIAVARENVERGTGGPFGAAIFNASGHLVSVGMNSVVRFNNCTLHGEMVAFMMAQKRVRSFTLSAPHLPVHELFTSCEPCAMCLGATLRFARRARRRQSLFRPVLIVLLIELRSGSRSTSSNSGFARRRRDERRGHVLEPTG